ncbi:MAG TPA: hypothetical protein VHN36_10200, partial [Ilumatobacteraceae bacterium]|nr:hypothetical protein [Ilumatobacteraceae bacterium]
MTASADDPLMDGTSASSAARHRGGATFDREPPTATTTALERKIMNTALATRSGAPLVHDDTPSTKVRTHS